ncbi:MAG: hypothetical protein IKA31_01085, partial [Clostridia bacterium]|nr:hypothetical protein [Clostridia bacterium]
MQILSKNFSLPKNIKTINNSPTKQVSNPNFKSSKTKIAKELGNELTKHLQRENIKDILTNPKKKTLFFEMVGATIVATVSNIVNLMGDTDEEIIIDKKIKENVKQDKVENEIHIIGEKQEFVNTEEKTISPSNIKFERLKGTTPKIENDFQDYVNENFADDNITSDRLKLLFNKFGGSNRKKLFVYEDLTLKSGEILSFILEELKKSDKDNEKINSVINTYQKIQSVENPTIQAPLKEISIKIPDEIQEIINRYPNIKNKYNEIITTSKNKQEAKDRTKSINEFIHPDIKDLNKETLKKARQNINKNYT